MIEFGDIFDKTGKNRIKNTLPPELASLSQQFHENPKASGKTFSLEDVLEPILDLCTGSSHEDSCQKFLGVSSLISSLLPYSIPSPSNSYSPFTTTDEYAEAAVTSDANNISRRSIKVDTSLSEMYKALSTPLPPPSFSVNDYLNCLCRSCHYDPSYYNFCADFIGDIADTLIFNLRYIQLKNSFDEVESQYPSVEREAIQLDPQLAFLVAKNKKEKEEPEETEETSDSACAELATVLNSVYDADLALLTIEDESDGSSKDNPKVKAFCDTILPKKMIHASFCQYSMTAFLSSSTFNPFLAFIGLKEISESKNAGKKDRFTSRVIYNNPHRTFRAMLDGLSSNFEFSPKSEDRWYLEKLFGYNTVMALFPFYGEETRSIPETFDISIQILKVLMKCKPLRLRIHLASTVSSAALLMKYDNEQKKTSCTNLYRPSFITTLIEPLRKTIEFFNSAYDVLLNLSYNLVQEHIIDAEDLLARNESSFALPASLVANSSFYHLSAENIRAISALYDPNCIEKILKYFPTDDAIKKEFNLRSDKISGFSALQTTALIENLENYHIPLLPSKSEK